MTTITFDRFDVGLDQRKPRAVSDPNRLWLLKNAYVTTGHSIRKRPGLLLDAALEPGTVGLVSAGGLLHTAYNGASPSISHANAKYQANYLPWDYPGVDSNAVMVDLVFMQQFAGYLYAVTAYESGTAPWRVRHHYRDEAGGTAWAATTAYALDNVVVPTSSNGWRYVCTTAGTSAGSEPTWPTTLGGTVTDGTVQWTAVRDGIRDAVINFQGDPYFANAYTQIAQSKIFVSSNETVRYSATDAARDWQTANDAGFLAAGRYASGRSVVNGLGLYQGNLAVFFEDSVQEWTVDPDPTNIALLRALEGVGTMEGFSVGYVAGDTFFRAPQGYRSISLAAYTNNLIDIDVGSAIERITKVRSGGSLPFQRGFWHPGGGQYVCLWDTAKMDVYTFSRTTKVSAWSTYEFGEAVTWIASYATDLYARAGDNVFVLDEDTTQDNGENFECLVEFPYLDFKRPGVNKQIWGFDVVMDGEAFVSFRYAYEDDNGIRRESQTEEITVNGNTRSGSTIPMELDVAEIAPVFRVVNSGSWELAAIDFHYNLNPGPDPH